MKNESLDFSRYPELEDLGGALERYVFEGILPGGFLTAVLENNLSAAIGRADSRNVQRLESIVRFIYNELPATCWGSAEKVSLWMANYRGVTK